MISDSCSWLTGVEPDGVFCCCLVPSGILFITGVKRKQGISVGNKGICKDLHSIRQNRTCHLPEWHETMLLTDQERR